MEERPYPEAMDCCWLASDQAGHLAVFLTNGRGPIPLAAVLDLYPLETIEERILELPAASDIDLRARRPRSDRFIALAERGFFVYDWSDVHRTEAYIDEYEVVALPYRPLTIGQLPEELSNAAQTARLGAVAFAQAWRIDVRAHATCREISG